MRVSPLALGTMTFRSDWGCGADDAEARRNAGTYVDKGGNFIDTSVNYTNGALMRLARPHHALISSITRREGMFLCTSIDSGANDMTMPSCFITTLVLVFILLTSNFTPTRADDSMNRPGDDKMSNQRHPYVGMWVTDDGRIRHELFPNGRYDEARGSRESAYQGRYEVNGDHIDYWDDTGFTADGVFVDENTLHHGGMIFRRR